MAVKAFFTFKNLPPPVYSEKGTCTLKPKTKSGVQPPTHSVLSCSAEWKRERPRDFNGNSCLISVIFCSLFCSMWSVFHLEPTAETRNSEFHTSSVESLGIVSSGMCWPILLHITATCWGNLSPKPNVAVQNYRFCTADFFHLGVKWSVLSSSQSLWSQTFNSFFYIPLLKIIFLKHEILSHPLFPSSPSAPIP